MRNQIVILAAGQGTRMGKKDLPKVLVMLKNKPLILYLLEELEKINQLAKAVIVIGYMAAKVRQVLGEHYLYAYQKNQLGTAHALLAARPQVIAENILVLYGDMPFIKAESLKKLMRLHHEKKANISLLTFNLNEAPAGLESLADNFGRVVRDETNRIIKIVEFKDAKNQEKQISELNPGIYMFNTKWLWGNLNKVANKNASGEYYLTGIVEIAAAQGEKIYSLPVNSGEVFGINTQEQLKQAESFLCGL